VHLARLQAAIMLHSKGYTHYTSLMNQLFCVCDGDLAMYLMKGLPGTIDMKHTYVCQTTLMKHFPPGIRHSFRNLLFKFCLSCIKFAHWTGLGVLSPELWEDVVP